MAKDPAFLFYYKDFDSDTADWEPEAIGWYVRLLCFQASNGYIPSEIEDLAMVARVKYSEFEKFSDRWASRIASKFKSLDDGKLHNKKLSDVQENRKNSAVENSIRAIFGNFVKYGNLSEKEKSHLKKEFSKPNEFSEIKDYHERKKTIIDFLNQTLSEYNSSLAPRSHIVNEDVNVNVNKKENKTENNITQVVETFHLMCPNLPHVKNITPARKSAIKARAKEYSYNEIGNVFQKVSESSFLNGDNEKNWMATFDWIMSPRNFIKILEDNYINKSKNEKSNNKKRYEPSQDLQQRIAAKLNSDKPDKKQPENKNC